MSLPKTIVDVRPVSGIASDVPPSQVAPEFYTGGSNIQFRDTFAERSSGEAAIYAGVLTELRNINNQQVGGLNFWVYQGIDTTSAVTELTHSDITIAGGLTAITETDAWTTGLLNGVYFANNGLDYPMYWDGNPANPMLELPNWAADHTCACMRAFKNFLFAFDITHSGTGNFIMHLHWSSAAEAGAVPATWIPAATNLAGDASLSETHGRIIDALPLGGNLIIYKQHSAYNCRFVGGNDVFEFSKLPITYGALARGCIADVNGKHIVVTDGDVIITDGNTAKSIIDNKMRRYLFDNLDQTNYQATFVVNYTAKNEVWVCFPTTGNTTCDRALVYDTQGGAWGVRTLPNIAHAAVGIVNDVASTDYWDDDSEVWDLDHTAWNEQGFSATDDSLVLAKSDDVTPTSSKLFQVDSGETFDGVNIAASISKYSMHFDAPERNKLVKRIYPNIVAADGTEVLIRVGAQALPDGPITFSAEQTFTVGTDEKIDTFAQGKYISFEFRSTGLDSWKLVGWQVDLEMKGYF